MSIEPKSISELAEYWDQLTPVQQQLMIQRAKLLAARNRMAAEIKRSHPKSKSIVNEQSAKS